MRLKTLRRRDFLVAPADDSNALEDATGDALVRGEELAEDESARLEGAEEPDGDCLCERETDWPIRRRGDYKEGSRVVWVVADRQRRRWRPGAGWCRDGRGRWRKAELRATSERPRRRAPHARSPQALIPGHALLPLLVCRSLTQHFRNIPQRHAHAFRADNVRAPLGQPLGRHWNRAFKPEADDETYCHHSNAIRRYYSRAKGYLFRLLLTWKIRACSPFSGKISP